MAWCTVTALELGESTVSDRVVGEYWQPLVDRLDDPGVDRVPLGRFELEEVVGWGGMGIVFRAHDPQLERSVALKLWNLDGDEAEQALLREAKLQAKVTHPNVVTIYETGKIGADVYIAMEYVRGMDARRWMDQYRATWQVVLAMLIHAGRGLAAIHERGLVHADFKPENILIGVDGRVLVADFGVARVLDEHEHEPRAGSSGRGTRAYMAPERLERRRTDARSDQFSFCVTLWECLHGVRPFAGGNVDELLGAMAVGEVRRARQVPEKLEEVLRRGLAIELDDRYPSMEELLRALMQAPVRTRPAERSWARVAGWVMVGAVAAFVGMFAVRARDQKVELDERALSRADQKVAERGINPEQGATTDMGRDGTAAEIAAMVAEDDIEAAFARWAAYRKAEVIAGSERAQDSLLVATAFVEQARGLEVRDPDLAVKSARAAMLVAPTVPMSQACSDQMAADAEQIMLDAADIFGRLRDQSKHSTVPSSRE